MDDNNDNRLSVPKREKLDVQIILAGLQCTEHPGTINAFFVALEMAIAQCSEIVTQPLVCCIMSSIKKLSNTLAIKKGKDALRVIAQNYPKLAPEILVFALECDAAMAYSIIKIAPQLLTAEILMKVFDRKISIMHSPEGYDAISNYTSLLEARPDLAKDEVFVKHVSARTQGDDVGIMELVKLSRIVRHNKDIVDDKNVSSLIDYIRDDGPNRYDNQNSAINALIYIINDRPDLANETWIPRVIELAIHGTQGYIDVSWSANQLIDILHSKRPDLISSSKKDIIAKEVNARPFLDNFNGYCEHFEWHAATQYAEMNAKELIDTRPLSSISEPERRLIIATKVILSRISPTNCAL